MVVEVEVHDVVDGGVEVVVIVELNRVVEVQGEVEMEKETVVDRVDEK